MSKTISNFKYNSNPIEIKSIIPVGTIVIFGGLSSNIPTNWHICDGTTLNTTSNPELYNIIGSRYNNGGEASGTFRIPNLVDKYVLSTTSAVTSSNYSAGSNTMVVNQIPAHTHTFAATTTNEESLSLTGRIFNTYYAGAHNLGYNSSSEWMTHWSHVLAYLNIPVTGGSHVHNLSHTASTQGVSSSETVSLGITHKKLYYIIKISV